MSQKHRSRRFHHARIAYISAIGPAKAVVEELEPRTLLTSNVISFPYWSPAAGVEGAAADAGGVITFELTRSTDDPDQALTVNLAAHGTGDYPATPGDDFVVPATATFPAGEYYASATVDVSVTDDNLPEPDETFALTVEPGSGYDVDPAAATTGQPGSIAESDVPHVWAEPDTSAPDAATATEGGDNALILLKRDNTVGSLVVRYQLLGDWGPDGASASADDYAISGSTPDENGIYETTFADGQDSLVVQVRANDDHEAEPYREGFEVLPADPAAGYGAVAGDDKYFPYRPDGQSAAGYGLIQDNDYDLSLSVNDSAIEGQDGVAGFDIYRYGDLRQPLTVSFDVGGSATLGEDYDSSPFDAGQATFAAGESDAWLALTPTDDETAEWTEDVILTIQPSDTIDINGDVFATAQIVDDDPVDVIIQGLPEESEASPNEMDPGGLLDVNDDDDNGNGVPDNAETQVDLNDDELEPVALNMPTGDTAGTSVFLYLNSYTPAAFRVWDANGNQLLGAFGGVGDPVTSVQLDPANGDSQTVYLEAIDAGQCSLTLAANDAATRPSNSSDTVNAATGTPADGDLDVATISHNGASGVLNEKLEKSQGAFVPVNNDDDDYSATGTGYGEDLSQAGQVTGEDDLLPIIIRAINVPNTTVSLTGAGLNVYYNADRTNPVALGSSHSFAAPQQDLTLYVEATSANAKSITLWVNGKQTKQTISIHPFQWYGPLNVPQYGTYKYTVTEPPQGGKWLNPSGGNVEAGAGTSSMDIFWTAGPQVGKAIYQAHPDYVWDLEVNVVEVVVGAPTAGPAFTPGVVASAGNGRAQAVGPGLSWAAKVTFNGPTLNGQVDRGLRQMRAGFVQNLTVTTFRGHYTNGTTAKSSLEGSTYWDTITRASYVDKFYSTAPTAVFENADGAQNRKSAPLSSDDSPRGGAPTVFNGSTLTSIDLVWDFNLYVVGVTKDTRNAQKLHGNVIDVYVSQAMANWKFNGTGTISPNNNYVWTARAGAGVTAPAGWGGVIGDIQPETVDPRFNDIVNVANWVAA